MLLIYVTLKTTQPGKKRAERMKQCKITYNNHELNRSFKQFTDYA